MSISVWTAQTFVNATAPDSGVFLLVRCCGADGRSECLKVVQVSSIISGLDHPRKQQLGETLLAVFGLPHVK